MLGGITIRYICDTHRLNISVLYRISTFFLMYFFPYNIITIILISLHRTAGPPRCPFFTYLQYVFSF